MNDIPENEINSQAAADAESGITEGAKNEGFNLGKEIFEWIYTLVIALAIAFVIKGFIFDVVRVDGPSMESTLINNDRLIITKLGYTPHSQDIIILDSNYKAREKYYDALEMSGQKVNAISKTIDYFSLPANLKKRYYVKRIIGLPGQTVDIVDGRVLVDGEVLDEPYLDSGLITSATDSSVNYPITVSEDCVFVMGDNRPHSKDSRSSDLGEVPIDAILGKAQIRIWPLNSIGLTK